MTDIRRPLVEFQERSSKRERLSTSSYDVIAAEAHRVRALYDRRRITLHRDSELSKMLRAADRLAKDYAAGNELDSPETLVAAANVMRIASAILQTVDGDEMDECLRRMSSGSMDLAERATSQGKDALWQVELAAMLCRQGIDAVLEEPDLVVNLGYLQYPIACKKIYSSRGVEGQVRSAVRQLRRFGSPGIIAINIDDLTPARTVAVSSDMERLGTLLSEFASLFIQQHVLVLQKYVLNDSCHGFLVTTNVVSSLAHERPAINTMAQSTLWTLSRPYGPKSPAFFTIADQLSQLLFR